MRASLLIAAKDLRQRLRDRSVLVFTLVLPLGLGLVFSLVLGDLADGNDVFRYAVADADGGQVAAVFTHQVLPAASEGGAITVRTASSTQEALRLVDDGDVTAAFILPPAFTARVMAGQEAVIEVVGDVDAPLGTGVARSLAESFTARLTSVRVSVAAALRAGSTRDPARLAAEAASVPDPLRQVEIPASRRELDATTYYAAGMSVFFLFFTVQFGVTSLLDERRAGTLARLLASPIRPLSVLLGKLITSLVVGTVGTAVLVAATSVLMGARWGHPVGVGILVLTGVLAATGVVAVVASLARTSEQAGGWQAVVAISLGALGGAFFPVAQVGGPLAVISLVSPHRWFLRGLADLAGGDVRAVLPSAGALTAFALVGFGTAYLLGRREVRL
ncbi:ABC transporter permease [Umezawaea endophytica]|uniref:ABC transporter permease n=1 Tax=Umezawaea endophytica TaxID=1654476 RepID=A0A9X3A7U5_9PSEU|nr:ABC transporter permease [Umezawaea endophytica]MCS7484753.1 ABC transporter permease [Umezawaea endophytica]